MSTLIDERTASDEQTQTDQRIQFSGSAVTTPQLRSTLRRLLFWIGIAVLLVLIALLTFASVAPNPSTSRLAATNPKPTGAEALIQVLRADGVTVHAPRTLASATHEASESTNATTVMVYDPTSILDTTQLQSLTNVGTNLILILPTGHELDVLAPSVDLAGDVASTAKADCSYRPVRSAGSVSGLQQGYRIATRTLDEQGCLGTGGVYSLIRVNNPNQTVTILGSTTMLTNGSIAKSGNAALALGLFGSTKNLIWYRPSFADESGVPADGVFPAPSWVSLVIILAALVIVFAALWRARRFGPIVVERMPVSVRASETLHGRARLYQKASARSHALDALRVGTITRIAKLCGLPHLATVDEVIAAVSTTTRHDPQAVRALLVDDIPTTDLQLVNLSDELRKLEDDVVKAVVPA